MAYRLDPDLAVLVMLLVMFVMLALFVFVYAAFANERKLLAIIQKPRDNKDHGR